MTNLKISAKEAAECVYDSDDADWLESDDDLHAGQ